MKLQIVWSLAFPYYLYFIYAMLILNYQFCYSYLKQWFKFQSPAYLKFASASSYIQFLAHHHYDTLNFIKFLLANLFKNHLLIHLKIFNYLWIYFLHFKLFEMSSLWWFLRAPYFWRIKYRLIAQSHNFFSTTYYFQRIRFLRILALFVF